MPTPLALRSRIGLLLFAAGIAFTTLPLTVCAQADDFTVDAPANTSPAVIVSSPFYMQVEAPECNGAPTTSLGYTVSGQSGTTYVTGTTIATMVTEAAGSYTIYLKSYNGTGHECTLDVPVTVGSGVSVTAPSLSATLPETFNLIASAANCGGQTTTGMDYNVDSQSGPAVTDGGALNTTVDSEEPSGAHVLRVKAWGGSNYCETDIPFSVVGGIAVPAGASVYSGTTTSYPFSGIESDANYTGSYSACPEGSKGSGNLGATSSAVGEWQTQPDCNTDGNKTNVSTTWPSTGAVHGQNPASRQFTFDFNEDGGGVRWFNQLPDNTAANNATYFLYDVYVYIAPGSSVGEIEMDLNQASPANNYYQMAVQCDLANGGVWDVTISGSWKPTTASCNTSQVTTGAWHHLQVQYHRSGSIIYDQASVDGDVQPLTCSGSGSCQNSEENTGWAESVGPNFQLDGSGSSGSVTAYASNMNIWYWVQ